VTVRMTRTLIVEKQPTLGPIALASHANFSAQIATLRQCCVRLAKEGGDIVKARTLGVN
jgi:hypothetical protein